MHVVNTACALVFRHHQENGLEILLAEKRAGGAPRQGGPQMGDTYLALPSVDQGDETLRETFMDKVARDTGLSLNNPQVAYVTGTFRDTEKSLHNQIAAVCEIDAMPDAHDGRTRWTPLAEALAAMNNGPDDCSQPLAAFLRCKMTDGAWPRQAWQYRQKKNETALRREAPKRLP